MGQRKIKIMLEVTVRDYTKIEREEEGLENDECVDASADFDAEDLADTIAQHVEDEQDELLAGSGSYVKIKAVTATVEG